MQINSINERSEQTNEQWKIHTLIHITNLHQQADQIEQQQLVDGGNNRSVPRSCQVKIIFLILLFKQ